MVDETLVPCTAAPSSRRSTPTLRGPQEPGAILGKEGDSLRALYYLRRSHEIDPQDPQRI